jgi:hypothetical protein
MGKVVRRTTTVTEEILDKDSGEDLGEDTEDLEFTESEGEESKEEEEGRTRGRKRRR